MVLPVPRLGISGLDTLDSGSLLKITQSREDHQLNYLAHDTTEPLAISHPGHCPATWAVVTPVTCRYIDTSSSMGTLNTETLGPGQECGTVVCRIVIICWPGICSDLHCLQCTKHPSVSPSRCLLQGSLITTPLHHPDHHPQHPHFLPRREYYVMGAVVREIFHWMIKTGTCLNEVELGEGGGPRCYDERCH